MTILRQARLSVNSPSNQSSLPDPPLRPWSGEHEAPPFSLVHEITSKDLIDDIPKSEFYQPDRDSPSVSMYSVPNYLLQTLTTILFIDEKRSYPFERGINAALWYGYNRYISLESYQSIVHSYSRFQHACREEEINIDDRQDIDNLLKTGLKLSQNDCRTGMRKQKNWHVPIYIRDRVSGVSKIIDSTSASGFMQRWIMDGLRGQNGVQKEYREAMNYAVESDLYYGTERLARKFKNMLNGILGKE